MIRSHVTAGVGYLVLDRPRAINALNLEMVQQMTTVLTEFAADAAVERVEVSGEGERGFCAGADVRWLREKVLNGEDLAVFFSTEYQLNLLIWDYPKPYTAWMRGITMGGGLGISAHSNNRVVTADSNLAMPETKIGFFPDVLMTWHLARMPYHLGTHLALTGNAINAGDALWLGLADRCDEEHPSPTLLPHAEWIAECYSADSASEIIGRLEQHSNPAARETGALLRTRCPLSLAVTIEALRRSRSFADVADQCKQDLKVATALTLRPDFVEGVRAQLVDRDQNPHWSHANTDTVTPKEVLSCFR